MRLRETIGLGLVTSVALSGCAQESDSSYAEAYSAAKIEMRNLDTDDLVQCDIKKVETDWTSGDAESIDAAASLLVRLSIKPSESAEQDDLLNGHGREVDGVNLEIRWSGKPNAAYELETGDTVAMDPPMRYQSESTKKDNRSEYLLPLDPEMTGEQTIVMAYDASPYIIDYKTGEIERGPSVSQPCGQFQIDDSGPKTKVTLY